MCRRRCAGRGGVQRVGLTGDSAVVAGGIGDLELECVAAGKRHTVPCQRGTRNLVGDVGPGRSVVERAVDDVGAARRAAERSSNRLRGGGGDEVGTAAAGGGGGRGAAGGGRRRGGGRRGGGPGG